MSLTYRTGDILADGADVLVNPVNCVGVAFGVPSLEFKWEYQAMFRDYRRKCLAGQLSPGRVHWFGLVGGRAIANLPTRRHWCDASRIEDIDAGLADLAIHLIGHPTMRSVALPSLGGGPWGGPAWDDVRPLIEQRLGRLALDVRVYVPVEATP